MIDVEFRDYHDDIGSGNKIQC